MRSVGKVLVAWPHATRSGKIVNSVLKLQFFSLFYLPSSECLRGMNHYYDRLLPKPNLCLVVNFWLGYQRLNQFCNKLYKKQKTLGQKKVV